ncbi:methyltransferase [Marinilongibacter aquaticus]|uniref:methyltransferase n=1 Tax=Marinilongibacter aquaticus TaxID=2975157 RepID=UPI0021BD1544|nr:methyltransferase [Marinilongibacter aquaticus]
MLNWIKGQELLGQSFLELGCGSGAIALFAAKRGAVVVASDINRVALLALHKNAKENNVALEIIESDLFRSIPYRQFDWIVINPPYYPQKPASIKESAWFCGENFEYFSQLFTALSEKNWGRNIAMILSEDCDLTRIQDMAKTQSIEMTILESFANRFEKNYIFQLKTQAQMREI